MNWSPVNRPVTLGEIAAAFRVPADRVEGLVARHHIGPALRIGRLRLYGSDQVRRIHSLIHPSQEGDPSAGAP
jgi:hypothetical protein